jgi:hypothetical protein
VMSGFMTPGSGMSYCPSESLSSSPRFFDFKMPLLDRLRFRGPGRMDDCRRILHELHRATFLARTAAKISFPGILWLHFLHVANAHDPWHWIIFSAVMPAWLSILSIFCV